MEVTGTLESQPPLAGTAGATEVATQGDPDEGRSAEARPAEDRPAEDQPAEDRRATTFSRLTGWAVAVLAAAVLLASSEPMLLAPACLALAVMIAMAMAAPATDPRGTSVTILAPAGFVVLVAWGLLWGLAEGAVGMSAWSGRGAALVGVAGLVAMTGGAARMRGGRVVLVGRGWPGLTAATLLAAFFTWVVAHQPLELWSRINAGGTDFLRHLGYVQHVRGAGGLQFGAASYPRGLHAMGAWLTEAAAIPSTPDALWRAIAPVGFLMLVLVLIAIASTATRVVDHLLGTSWPGVAAAACTTVVFVQTAWFSSVLSFGAVMNTLVALCLTATLAVGTRPTAFRSAAARLAVTSALVVVANGWQLLAPVVAVTALPWLVADLRHRRRDWRAWATWAVAAVLCANGALGLRGMDGTAQASTPTVSNLFRPDWWWGIGVGLAILACLVAFRAGWRAWAASAFGSVVAGAAVVVILFRLTGSTWELMLYYPVKALWTAMVVVIPLATIGGVWLVVAWWRRTEHMSGAPQTAARSVVLLVLGATLAATLGRGAAFPPHLVGIAHDRSGLPNWALAVADAVEDVPVTDVQRPGAIIFGILPSASTEMVSGGFVGMVDYLSQESLDLLGFPDALAAPVKVGLYKRTMTDVCHYLLEHPDSLRLTGPNPAAGAPWIVASGCPEDIVKPERWISLDLDPAWFQDTHWLDGPWRFPEFADVTRADQG